MALATERDVELKDGEILAHKMAAVKIFQGALVMINAAGYVTNASDAAGFFAGIAVETVDNSAGAAGDKEIRVYKRGNALLIGSGFAQADVGEVILASANDTVTKTSAANRPIVGVCVEVVSATKIWVELKPHQANAAS